MTNCDCRKYATCASCLGLLDTPTADDHRDVGDECNCDDCSD